LNALKAKKMTKQVIVIRKDLNMRKGKMVAQGSHASMAFLTRRLQDNQPVTEIQKEWLDNSFTKICVSVDSEQELLEIYEKAKNMNIECHIVTDNGTTEFNGVPTKTCLALGPDKAEILDQISGHLKLL
jgi:peptidyl-tRNA hydrolase, PTH2 family